MMIHACQCLEIKGYNITHGAQACDGSYAESENPAVVVEERQIYDVGNERKPRETLLIRWRRPAAKTPPVFFASQ